MRWLFATAGALALVALTGPLLMAGGPSDPDVQAVAASRPADAERLAPASEQLSLPELHEVLVRAGWPDAAIPAAVQVAGCESGWRPGAVGKDGEEGLFQIHPVHQPRFTLTDRDPFEPVANAAVALEVWRQFGWDAWTCDSYPQP